MIARISKDVYSIKGNYNVYVIVNKDTSILIDSSDGTDYTLIIEGIEEILTRYNTEIKYLILTSHYEEVAGGAYYLSTSLRIPYIIASSEDSISIRKGRGKRSNYNPVNINFEIKEGRGKINSLNFIKSRSPSLGSLLIIYSDIIFSGVNKVSGIMNKINYICDINDCKKVEEFWYLRKNATLVEDIRKQSIVE
ncbi:hypothetical protein SJAV_12630 [Sulfurisphaera javensis]|uniref:MBL fold metallo-hydrolase n=1 Tax=Sulfurisphaera javensis TaxID=2049879 RepID=A0AAT9GRJ3_9CREN